MQQFMIVAFREGEPDRHCMLTGDSCIIGRAPNADLVLPDSTISRNHAIIGIDRGQVFVEDYKSTNGVFVNGEQVKRSVLREGDFLTVGAYTVVMRALDRPEEQAAPQGDTVCMGFETARRLHEESLKSHCSKLLPTLYRTALLLGKRGQLEEVLRRVLAMVLETLPARRGAILVRADESGEPRVAAAMSVEGEADEPFLSRTLIGYVLRTRTALLTEDAQTDPRFCSSDTVVQHRIGAAMCAPLCGASRAVGVIYADNCGEKACFTKRELEFLSAIGQVVGMAVENRLLDETMVRHERLAALGQAIAGISHDVKNIVVGIKGGVELLEHAQDGVRPVNAENASRIIQKASMRLEAYLADLLVFAKEPELTLSSTCISDLARDAIDLVQTRAAQHSVALTLAGESDVHVEIDEQQIQRVLVNLIKNAVDACETNSGAVTVSVGRETGAVMVRVSDTGVGVAQENLRRLWEPFFSTKGSGGTGLGLAISHRIVEKHGGRITVASEPGKGSAFTVYLPAPCATPLAAPVDAESAKQTSDASDDRGINEG